MIIKVNKEEEVRIEIGCRIWVFSATGEDEVYLLPEGRGINVHADVKITPYIMSGKIPTGVRLNVIKDR